MQNKNIFSCVLCASALLSASAIASTEQTMMDVSLTVEASCSVTASSMDFGTSNIASNSSLSSSSDLTVTCTNGTPYALKFTSANADATKFNLKSGEESIHYNLYSDTEYTNQIDSGVELTQTYTGTSIEQMIKIFGTIDSDEIKLAKEGQYTDAVTVSLNY